MFKLSRSISKWNELYYAFRARMKPRILIMYLLQCLVGGCPFGYCLMDLSIFRLKHRLRVGILDAGHFMPVVEVLP